MRPRDTIQVRKQEGNPGEICFILDKLIFLFQFILDELMFDLEPEVAKKVLDRAWRNKYGFLLIKSGMPTEQKYFDKFDQIDIKSL